MTQHTFVICAYKKSEYLEECMQSLRSQTVKSSIILVTSTPNAYIRQMASRYNLPLVINEGQAEIVQDWNFAYHQANTPYVTIAHQDDVYLAHYTEEMFKSLEIGCCS